MKAVKHLVLALSLGLSAGAAVAAEPATTPNGVMVCRTIPSSMPLSDSTKFYCGDSATSTTIPALYAQGWRISHLASQQGWTTLILEPRK